MTSMWMCISLTLILYAESIVSNDRSDFSSSWPRTLSRHSCNGVRSPRVSTVLWTYWTWTLKFCAKIYAGCWTPLGGLVCVFLLHDRNFFLTCHLKTVQDLAQYIQEEMYHFVLGPDMMERVRPGSRFRVFLVHWFLHSFCHSFLCLFAC